MSDKSDWDVVSRVPLDRFADLPPAAPPHRAAQPSTNAAPNVGLLESAGRSFGLEGTRVGAALPFLAGGLSAAAGTALDSARHAVQGLQQAHPDIRSLRGISDALGQGGRWLGDQSDRLFGLSDQERQEGEDFYGLKAGEKFDRVGQFIGGLPAQVATFPLQTAERAQDLVQQGVPADAAMRATLVNTGVNALTAALPAAVKGPLLARIASGAMVGAASGIAGRQAEKAALGEDAPKDVNDAPVFSTEDLGAAALGAIIGGAHGRGGAPREAGSSSPPDLVRRDLVSGAGQAPSPPSAAGHAGGTLTPDEVAVASSATDTHPDDIDHHGLDAVVSMAAKDPQKAQELANAHASDAALSAAAQAHLQAGAVEKSPQQPAGEAGQRDPGASPPAGPAGGGGEPGGPAGQMGGQADGAAAGDESRAIGTNARSPAVGEPPRRLNQPESTTAPPQAGRIVSGAGDGEYRQEPSSGANKDGLPLRTGENVGLSAGMSRDNLTSLHDRSRPEFVEATHTDETGVRSQRPFSLLESTDYHERVEKALLDAGHSYPEAHRAATESEHARVRQLGFDPNEVESLQQPYVDAAAHRARALGDTTAEVSSEPYRDSGENAMRADGGEPDPRFVLDRDGNKYTEPLHGKLLDQIESVSARRPDDGYAVLDPHSGRMLAQGANREAAKAAAGELARGLGRRRLQAQLDGEPALSQQQLRERFKERYPEVRIGGRSEPPADGNKAGYPKESGDPKPTSGEIDALRQHAENARFDRTAERRPDRPGSGAGPPGPDSNAANRAPGQGARSFREEAAPPEEPPQRQQRRDAGSVDELARALSRIYGRTIRVVHVPPPNAAASALASAVRRLFGRKVVFVRSDDPGMQGAYLGGKTLFVNADADRPHAQIIGHELLHSLRREAPGVYQQLVLDLHQALSQERGRGFKEYLSKLYQRQGLPKLNFDSLHEELIAEVVGDHFADPAFIRQLQKTLEPGLFRRIAAHLGDFIDQVRGRLTGRRQEMGRQAARFVDDLDAARGAVREALRQIGPGWEAADFDVRKPAFSRSKSRLGGLVERLDNSLPNDISKVRNNTPPSEGRLASGGGGDEIRSVEENAAHVVDRNQQKVGPPATPDTVAPTTDSTTTKLKWGSLDLEVRPAGPGFWGRRIRQDDPRVNAFELKINPKNESFYLPHPDGSFVQFENFAPGKIQDGKLVMKPKSIYRVYDVPYAQKKILRAARRQIEAATAKKLQVQWLVSDREAALQLSRFLNVNGLNIDVIYFPE